MSTSMNRATSHRLGVGATSLAVLVGALAVLNGATSALSPGIAFSADHQSTWQTDGIVYALDGNAGKVVAGGNFTQLRPPEGGVGDPVAVQNLAILDAETGAPSNCQFDVTFAGGTPTVRAAKAAPDGRTVYIGGDFTSVGGVAVTRAAGLDLIDCAVTAFRPDHIGGMVRTLDVFGDTMYIGGDFTTVDIDYVANQPKPRLRFAAIDIPSGRATNFIADADASGRGLAVSPDGTKVAIGGSFFNVNGQATHSIAVVDAITGANLRNYTNGFISDRSVTKHIWSDESRFYISNEGTGGGVFDGRAALDWDTLDEVWRDNCLGATQASLTHQGTLYSASHAHNCNDRAFGEGRRNMFLAQSAATGDHYGWDPRSNDGIGEGIGPRAMAVVVGTNTGNAYLWYGGEFTAINGVPQQGLTRFGPEDTDPPPVPAPAVVPTAEGTIQVRWRSVVDPDDSEITYQVFRNGASTPIWTGVASSVWWKRPQVTFVDTNVTPGVSYTYRVNASDGTNTSAVSAGVAGIARTPESTYATTVRASAPSLYWDSYRNNPTTNWLHEVGATASDTRRINGLAQGGPVSSTDSPVLGDTTGSLTFNGSSNYLWEDENVLGPTVYTLETWIKTTTTRGGSILGYGRGRPRTDTGARIGSPSGGYDRILYMENGGRVRFAVNSGGFQTVRSRQSLNDGQWHHLVGMQGPAGMALFVDGVRAESNSVSNAGTYLGVWHLGGDSVSGLPSAPTSLYFSGQIDETAVYPTTLSRETIAAHYQAATGVSPVNARPGDAYGGQVYDRDPDLYWRLGETSGQSLAEDSSYFGVNSGTYQSNVTREAAGILPGNTAITTPGSNSGTVSTGTSLAAPNRFSAEVWFNTTTNDGGKLFGYESSLTGSSSSRDRSLYMRDNGRLSFGTNINGSISTIDTSAAYNDGQWHHAVAVLDNAGSRLYVDGDLVATSNNSGAQSFSGYWRIGGGSLSGWPNRPKSDYFAGRLDEFAVYDATLTPAQITANYAVGSNDTQAPTAPTGLSSSVTDQSVALSWTASSDNIAVTGYEVFRGLVPDFTPGAANSVGTTTATSLTTVAPGPGTYYFKVVAADAAGNPSVASAPLEVVVPDVTAPSVPDPVTATQSGPDSVTVAWSESTDDVATTGYLVYRGTTEDFTADAGSLLGTAGTSSFPDTGVAAGDYFYKVRAFDAAGNTSAASAAAAVTVVDQVAPTTPTDVTAVLDGPASVTVSWTASTDNVGVAAYEVHRGADSGFTPDAGNLVGTVAGDQTTFTDSGLLPAEYYYKVVAADATGNRSAASAAAQATLPDTTAPTAPSGLAGSVVGEGVVRLTWNGSSDNVGVTGYRVHRGATAGFSPGDANLVGTTAGATTYDDTGVASGAYFYKVIARDAAGNRSEPSAAAEVGVTLPPVTVDVIPTADARVSSALPTSNYGTDVQLAANGGTTGAAESFLRFALPAAPSGRQLTGATLTLRTSGDPSAGTAASYSINLIDNGWTEDAVTWNNRPTAAGALVATINGATTHNTTFQFAASPSVLSGSLGQDLDVRIAPTSSATTDNLRLWSREGGNGLRPVLTLTFTETSGPAPDTLAPNRPTNVTATKTAVDQVTVTWDASSDDVGVTGYRVHRGATADFTPVTAHDAAGNLSNPSAAGAVTVPNPSAPVTVVIEPVADARVAASQATSNYGSDTQLAASGGNNPVESFLRFSLPAAPEGKTLTEAVLSVRTSGDPSAGTQAPYNVRLTDDTWTEGAVTWNTRPTTAGGLVATITGATTHNTSYQFAASPAALAGSLGQSTSLRVATEAANTDNLRLWSREASAAFRPTLTLTFTETSGPPPDTVAPSAPTGVAATKTGPAEVTVAWNAASDDTGVTGYAVHRGATADFTPAAGNQVGTTGGATTFVDSGVAPGTHFYKVTARDAAGNVGAASNPGSVDVPDPSQPVTVVLEPTADSRVFSAQPTSNYGLDSQLAVNGGTSTVESFLRFTLPAAPEGTALTGVQLSVRTSGDPTAGTTATYSVNLSGNDWTETGITWNNRPTLVGELLASITGATATNSAYQYAGDPAALVGSLGQDTTVRIAPTEPSANDNLRLWSLQGPAAYRPTLTLTFTPQ
jgi:fibronectin type 3 domain-containing protein